MSSAATFAGLPLSDIQIEQLDRYRGWLAEEAYRAGGIGPDELPRLEQRHLADSLIYARYFPHDATEVCDLGSGVGLPGIPLAIALPRVRFHLVDRSERRCDLIRRAIRLLGLHNCVVEQIDIDDVTAAFSVVVSRASLPPAELIDRLPNLLKPGGAAVVAGSWQTKPVLEGWVTEEIPAEVLDHTVWLLIMRRA